MAMLPAQAQNIPLTTGPAAPPASSVAQQEGLDIQKRLSELSEKVNEQPDIQKLRAQMVEARNAYYTAFGVAISKEDPDILAKADALNKTAMPAKSGPTPRIRPGFAQLSSEDRSLLLVTRTAALEVPAVKTARDKRNAAKTEEERKSAEADYKAVLRKAMEAINPKVGPLLDELADNPLSAPAMTPGPTPAVSPTQAP